jgi:hypothetical protein
MQFLDTPRDSRSTPLHEVGITVAWYSFHNSVHTSEKCVLFLEIHIEKIHKMRLRYSSYVKLDTQLAPLILFQSFFSDFVPILKCCASIASF